MPYFSFDTETTGIFDYKLPADDPAQPRLASLAAIVLDDSGQEVNRHKFYIKPDGWTMPDAARAVNGLTDEFLAENGVPVSEVLDLYEGYVNDGHYMAAFNAQFDAKMMRAEFRRAGRDDLFEQTKQTCIMRAQKAYESQGIMMKRGTYISLAAACEFHGVINDNPHDAMADAEAATELLKILISDGNVLPPKVHYAKGKDAA